MSGVRAVLTRPGVPSVAAWSFVGRLPTAAAPLALLILLHDRPQGVAGGGLDVGLYALGVACGQPVLSRLADRRGQSAVLVGSAVVSTAAFLVLLAPVSAPVVAVVATVAGAGTPPLEPCLRALWPALVRGPSELHAAFALDASLIELVYVIGPLATVTGTSLLGPGGGIVFCAVSGLAGTMLFASTRASRAARGTPPAAHVTDRLFTTRYLRLLAVLVAAGFPVGALSILVVGYADAHHHEGLAGLALSLNAGGALVGSWLAAVMRRPAGPARALLVLAAGYLPLAAPLPPVGWLAACAVAGVPLPRLLAASFAEAQAISPRARMTEANAWIITAFGCGVALSSAGAGIVAGSALARPITIAGCAAVCLVAVVACGTPASRSSLTQRSSN